MKYLIFTVLMPFSLPACFKSCFPDSKQKKEHHLQKEATRIAQINNQHDLTMSFEKSQLNTRTKTIVRIVPYSQKDSARWAIKVIEDPCSCILIPEPDEILENQNLSAQTETNNILYTWNIQIKSVGIAKLQAIFTSPEKTEIQEFTITVTD